MILLSLYWEFFKTGLFAVGGGMATIPFLQEMGLRTGWFSPAALADMLAVSESTPGPIGINMATYVGYTVGGVPGGLVATLGEITPSVLIVLLIAAALRAFRNNRTVERAFYGMRPASLGLIAAAGLGVMRLCLLDEEAFAAGGQISDLLPWKGLLLFALLWCLTNLVRPTKRLHPVVWIAVSAAVGVLAGGV
jgi:chromate transporter